MSLIQVFVHLHFHLAFTNYLIDNRNIEIYKKNIFCLISSSQNTNVYKSFCRFFFNIQHHGSDYAIPIQTTNTRWWYGNIEHRGNYIKIDVHCVTLRRKNSDKTRQIRFIIILSNNQKLKSFQDSMIDKNVAQVQWLMP